MLSPLSRRENRNPHFLDFTFCARAPSYRHTGLRAGYEVDDEPVCLCAQDGRVPLRLPPRPPR
jgi:hypothetical protein